MCDFVYGFMLEVKVLPDAKLCQLEDTVDCFVGACIFTLMSVIVLGLFSNCLCLVMMCAATLDHIDLHCIEVFGPPCQPFSPAGKRAGQDDPRCGVMMDCVKFVVKKHPQIFIMENVRCLETMQ